MRKQLKSLSDIELQSLLDAREYPFLNNTFVEDINVPPLQSVNFELSNSILNELGEYPNFKNVDSKDLINLRLLVHLKSTDNGTDKWCEKIHRYVEINYTKLKANEKNYGRSNIESRRIFNQVIALFVEYYLNTKDLLFLNTALKLIDLKWARPKYRTSNALYVLREVKLVQCHAILQNIENE